MTDFSIIPHVGVNGLSFGADLSRTRARFRGEFHTFRKSRLSVFPVDHFISEGVFCYYDRTGNLDAIEFASPSRPQINGLYLLELPFDEVISALSEIDNAIHIDDSGATSYRLGIGVFAPLAKGGSESHVESVIVFRRGYYDEGDTAPAR